MRQQLTVTRAQARVIEELCREGAVNAVIAERLGVTEQTVKFHVGNAIRAVDARTRTGLALWWLRGGRYQHQRELEEREEQRAA